MWLGDLVEANLYFEGGYLRGHVSEQEFPDSVPTIDLGGRIVLPRLAEPHVHLDKCHTISRLHDVGGDLLHAIGSQARDHANWSAADIRERASRGLEELVASGCRIVRTHVDWSQTEPPLAWQIIGELAEDYTGQVHLQRAALIDLERFDDLTDVTERARYVAESNGVLGIFVRGHRDLHRRLKAAFELAEQYSLGLDFHVDEDASMEPSGVVSIVDVAIECSFEGPILCGHACSLINAQGDQLKRLVDGLARAAISVVALPSTNLYLQGRIQGTPVQRGITRVKELDTGGVTVAFGTDNVADPFCPFGRFDPLVSLSLGAMAAHLDPPYGAWVKTITSGAERAMGLAPEPFERVRVEGLLVLEATHTAELLRVPARMTLEAFWASFTDRLLSLERAQ